VEVIDLENEADEKGENFVPKMEYDT